MSENDAEAIQEEAIRMIRGIARLFWMSLVGAVAVLVWWLVIPPTLGMLWLLDGMLWGFAILLGVELFTFRGAGRDV